MDDAEDWERRLGLITNGAVSLADRKLAIQRKINHPGDIPARQHFLYLQGQLHDAGFTGVWVYENRFPIYPTDDCETMTPSEVFGYTDIAEHSDDVVHGDHVEHGQVESGSNWDDVIANNIDHTKDQFFDVGDNLRFTFFISGNPISDPGDVLF